MECGYGSGFRPTGLAGKNYYWKTRHGVDVRFEVRGVCRKDCISDLKKIYFTITVLLNLLWTTDNIYTLTVDENQKTWMNATYGPMQI